MDLALKILGGAPQSPEYPRPKGLPLSLTDLRAGDILLSRGDSKISDMIVNSDRASYSHAAIWTDSATIIEATLSDGIRERPPSGDRDVYRYRNLEDGGRPMTEEEAKNVLERAREHCKKPYKTSEILLLGVAYHRLVPLGKPRKSLAGALLETLGGKNADKLRAWLQESYARSAPRICTELVALCYYETGNPIHVIPFQKRLTTLTVSKTAASGDDIDEADAKELAALRESVAAAIWTGEKAVRTLAESLGVQETEARGLLWGDVAMDHESGIPVGVVTPGDLQFSPSLEFVGTVKFDVHKN